jgi:outer membrane protein, adhesin transport system
MKLQVYDFPSPFQKCLSLFWNGSASSHSLLRGVLSVTIGLSSTLMLASCGKKPLGRVEIADNLTAILVKKIPSRQSATAVSIPSDFGKALLQAVELNEGYRAALSLENALLADIGVAESARRWQINATSTAGVVREQGGTQNSNTTIGIAGGIQAYQLIYDGGESVANITSATADAVGAGVDRIIIGNELALEAARSWIDVWQYAEKIDLLKTHSKEIELLVLQIQRMASNGLVDRAALDNVLNKIVAISLEQTRLESGLGQAQVKFTRFFNQEPTKLEIPIELVRMFDARAQANSWQQAPLTRRKAVELIIAQNSVSAAQAAFKPKAKFQAGVTSPLQSGESTDINLGIGLEYALGDGGRRKAQLNAAEDRLNNARLSLLDAQRTLKAELDEAAQQLTTIELSMPMLARQITLSASAAQTAQSQLATGQVTLSELIEAKIQHYRAKDRQITTQSEKVALQLMIASQTGLLGRLIGLPIDITE